MSTYRGAGVGYREAIRRPLTVAPSITENAKSIGSPPNLDYPSWPPRIRLPRIVRMVLLPWRMVRLYFAGLFAIAAMASLITTGQIGQPKWPRLRTPTAQQTFNAACGTWAPAESWTLQDSSGPVPLYAVTCRQGVTLTAAGP